MHRPKPNLIDSSVPKADVSNLFREFGKFFWIEAAALGTNIYIYSRKSIHLLSVLP